MEDSEIEGDRQAQAQEVLEAEILAVDADWEGEEEDWEEGTLPDITPLAPDEAVHYFPFSPFSKAFLMLLSIC